MSTHSPPDSPAVLAARLTGTRRAFLSVLIDGDHETHTAPLLTNARRAKFHIGADGLIDWSRSPLPGDVTAWYRAEVAVGGAA